MADFATGPGRKLIELLRRANDGLAFQGTVYAFEAHPDMIESLWRNFDGSGLADQVKLVPFLVHTHEIYNQDTLQRVDRHGEQHAWQNAFKGGKQVQYAFCTEFYHEAISLPALEHGLERGLQLFEQTNANLGKIVAPGGKLYFADIHGVPNETGTRIIINPQAKNMFLELLHWIKDPDTAIDRNYQFSDLADENATYWAPRGEHRQRLAEMVHREKDSTAVDGNVLVEALWRMMLDDEHGSFVDLDEEVHTYFDHDSLMVHLNGAGFKPEDLFVFSDAAVSAFGSKYAGVLTPDPFPPIYTAGQFVKST